MKVEINKLPKSEIELNIVVSSEQWQEIIEETAKEMSRELKIEGFRPGHAPFNMVEARIGSSAILEHAAEHCVRECYIKAIKDYNIEAIGRPEISVTKIPAPYRTEGSGAGAKDPEVIPSGYYGASNPFEFKARVAIMPEIELSDYKKIAKDFASEKKTVEVKEEEFKKAIDWLLKSRAKHITVTRPAQSGDRVEIDFEGLCEGQNLPELCSKNHPAVLGHGYFVPGFEENIYGMKEGEEKQFEVSFGPDFDAKHLAGKTVAFKTKMNLVQEAELPKFDDEFAKSLGNFKDVAAVETNIREGLLFEKQEQELERWRSKVIEKIAKDANMEIPTVLLEGETQRMLGELKTKVTEIGLTFEQYLDKFKKTEDDLKKEMLASAMERVRSFLVLQKIADMENVQVTEEEIAEEVNHALSHFKTPEHAESNIDIEQLKVYTKDVLRNKKVFKILES